MRYRKQIWWEKGDIQGTIKRVGKESAPDKNKLDPSLKSGAFYYYYNKITSL